MPSFNSNMGMNDDVRTESETLNIDAPYDGQEVVYTGMTPWPFEVVRICRRCAAEECELTLYNHGEIVELDDARTDGHIDCEEGALDETFPDSTSVANYTVEKDNQLSFILDNVASGCLGLVVQIDYRRTQENMIT